MKIGILTYHSVFNCGAILQSFALKYFLEKNGHEVWYINYVHNIEWNIKSFIPSLSLIQILRACIRNYRIFRYGYVRNYNDILSNFTKKYESYEDLTTSPPDFDIYIAGSDQIWNTKFLISEDEFRIFFLDFGRKSTKRIAYAPSMGDSYVTKEQEPLIVDLLSKFDALSIREESGRTKLLPYTGGKDIKLVVDPTLLLCSKDYIDTLGITKIKGTRKILTTYLLQSVSGNQKSFVERYVNQHGLNHINIITPEYGVKFRNRNKTLKPSEWLRAILSAEYVITNSFHGVVFCLIFHKKFIALDYKKEWNKTNARIKNLLTLTGLISHFMDENGVDNYVNVIEEDINWTCVDEKLAELRLNSINYLQNNIYD